VKKIDISFNRFKNKDSILRKMNMIIVTSVSLMGATNAQADTTFKFDDDRSITVGAGLRTSFNSVEDGSPSGSSRSKDFTIDNMRFYFNAQVYKNIELEFNTERDSVRDEIRVLDAVGKFHFSDMLNIRLGRMVTPLDRTDLSGPYYMNGWDFPIAAAWPAIFQGRDDGAVAWGQSGGKGGQFKYYAGVFQGSHGLSNQDSKLAYLGRLAYNFWDPEPGYYNANTYYGAQDTLAIGVAGMRQGDATGTAADRGNFRGWSVDGLIEKKLSNAGVITLEGSYFDFDLDNKPWSVSGDEFPATQGTGYFAYAGYMFPTKVGIGNFRPNVRIERFDADFASPIFAAGKMDKWTLGLDYIIKDHNARFSVLFGETDTPVQDKTNFFRIGMQLQI